HHWNEVVPDVVIILVLESPFRRPGVKEEVPSPAFRGFPRFAAGGRQKSKSLDETAKSQAHLLRGMNAWKRIDKGYGIRQFHLKLSVDFCAFEWMNILAHSKR